MNYCGILCVALLYSFTSFGNTYVLEKLNAAIYPDTTKISKVNTSNKIKNDSIHRSLVVDSVISYSKNFIGYQYKYGSNGENKSFDCSHFVSYCYHHYRIEIPCSSAGLIQIGEQIKIDEVKPGDLMFFKGTNLKSVNVGHVSLVIENKDGNIKMIHATRRGVIIDEYLKMEYYRQRFLMARRIKIQ